MIIARRARAGDWGAWPTIRNPKFGKYIMLS